MNTNKFVILGAVGLFFVAVIAAILLDTGKSPYNELKTSAYSSTAEYSEEPKEFYYEGSLKTVGDYITLGSYEQDNNTSNGKEDIEWLVLEINDDKALLISKFALDCQSYNTGFEDVTWETCTLRSWLNNEFIDTAFTEYEKAMIPTVTVPAGANPSYSTDPGNDTQDKIFLLSIDEANEFFDSDFDRECKTSNYASEKPHTYTIGSDNCLWLLRSPGYDQRMTTYVESNGSVYEGDAYDLTGPVDINLPIRPALWINLNM